EVLPLLVVTCGALGAAILAARWLPIWAWDAIGYHLPYVNLVVMAHGLDGVPPAIPYISSYPHNVDLFTVALRLMLPDDRLVDLAQVPLGLLGAVATAAIARAHGAARSHAVAAGCAWLLVPAIFLQLPTDYVDVGSGAFLLCAVYFLIVPPSRRTLVAAGIALGLYLGSKPNGPMGTAVLGALLVVRGVQAKRVGATALAAGLVLAFGATSFVGNWLRYGNPTWPVELALGPWHFPGPKTMQQIIGSGAAMARTHGPLPLRMLTSWITFTSRPSFDMRIGGYGPLFVLALPFALVRLLGKPSPEASPRASWVALLATLASPEPAVARYVPAFPAFVLALAASSLVRLPLRARQVLLGLAAALGVYQVVYAWPGLTGEGPPLSEYAHMSDDERMRAVGSDGTPAPFIDARQRIGPGEVFAVNRLDDVPYYLAWGSRLENRVVWMPDELPTGSVEGYLEREKVRIFAAGNDGPVGRWAASHPDRAIPLFPCKSAPCTVYERR
ncbi:MAG TPA: hypothetical protein VNO21_22705, partial [Polyangiaceae bacterium]|nr:hypothetical protein [Polyangiaceae bacterium]